MANTGTSIRIGVIGVGGMGKRWAQVAAEHPQSHVVALCHPDAQKAQEFATRFSCESTLTWTDIVQRTDIDAVIIATPHMLLTEIAQAALTFGKHVFCEKPGGMSSLEIQKGVDIAAKSRLRYRVNFNIRLHPAVALAKQKIEQGLLGEMMFLRAVYGHAGREGYEQEWWCQKELSGGGELIDQGSHLVDLAHWFLGPFTSQSNMLSTGFWPIAPMEDNAFLLLQNDKGQIAQLHASWTHWKKTFRLELFGKDGYLIVDGLGGQYGLERLIHGERALGRDAPAETMWEFPSEPGKPDVALQNSWDEFVRSIQGDCDIGLTAKDAVSVLKLIESGYKP